MKVGGRHLPLYLQQLRGFSALETGLTTLPQGLGMAVALLFTSRMYPYIGPPNMPKAIIFRGSIAYILKRSM